MKRMGFSYDLDRMVKTCSPDYYRWGQWIFEKLWEKGLVYRKKNPVNWCPTCKTVLANEQVTEGKCWRCGTEPEKRDLEQWYFKITEYSQELLDDLEKLPGWPERVKQMQANWIGRSEGAEVDLPVRQGWRAHQGRRGQDHRLHHTCRYALWRLLLCPGSRVRRPARARRGHGVRGGRDQDRRGLQAYLCRRACPGYP